jgi:hypothetical protein
LFERIAALEAAGVSLLYLPPYSPDFKPIENAFSELKAHLRKAAERTVDGLWSRIGTLIPVFDPREAARENPSTASPQERLKHRRPTPLAAFFIPRQGRRAAA